MARLAYLSLETPRLGQASHTKITATCRELRALGFEVDLYATKGGGASSGRWGAFRILEQLALQLSLTRRLEAYGALYVRSHFMAWPIAFAASLRGVPVVQEVNGAPQDALVTYPVLRLLARPISWSYRSQYRRASRLVAVTDGLARWAARFAGHDRVSVVSNGADTGLFQPAGSTDLRLAPFVAFVGGLVGWHGLATMLAALDRPGWPEGVRLVVAGDGIERAQLERMADHPRLVWLGVKPQAEIAALLRGAAAALCIIEDPLGRSSNGVAPLKLLEAMACGVPVIVSDLEGQADLVRRVGAGLVVPMADAEAVAAAVAVLANDVERAREMGRKGAAYVQAEASWQRQATRLSAIIGEVSRPDPAAVASR